MPTTPTAYGEPALATEEEFLAMVCSDDDLVRAEFDAIIAAEWPTDPPEPPDHDGAIERSSDRAWIQPRGARVYRPNRPRHPGVGGWARQRSPPPRDTSN